MTEYATFAGGCFWCTEAIFERLEGVTSVISGYIGGQVKNPTYEQVCSGNTGHAEAIQISYDPEVISYTVLLEIFFATHDSTTLNRQGNDVGTQYRSAIFYHTEHQKNLAEKYMASIPGCTTQLAQASEFYQAETYHQGYYDTNRTSNPYCSLIIDPKVQKLIKTYSKFLKHDH